MDVSACATACDAIGDSIVWFAVQLFLNGLIANAVTRADSTFVQFLRSPPEDESKAASV